MSRSETVGEFGMVPLPHLAPARVITCCSIARVGSRVGVSSGSAPPRASAASSLTLLQQLVQAGGDDHQHEQRRKTLRCHIARPQPGSDSPGPWLDAIISPTTAPISAYGTELFIPVKIQISAEGRMTLRMIWPRAGAHQPQAHPPVPAPPPACRHRCCRTPGRTRRRSPARPWMPARRRTTG